MGADDDVAAHELKQSRCICGMALITCPVISLETCCRPCNVEQHHSLAIETNSRRGRPIPMRNTATGVEYSVQLPDNMNRPKPDHVRNAEPCLKCFPSPDPEYISTTVVKDTNAEQCGDGKCR